MSARPHQNTWSTTFREWRHNPCLMSPLSAFMIVMLSLFWFVALVLKFPSLIIALLLQPLASRFNWIVEFLYPMGIGRWIHFTILKLGIRAKKSKPTDKCYGYHSRTIESRLEVVKDRIYVHPLPQLMDNLGYLVVSLPPPGRDTMGENETSKIVGFVVDCGDAAAVIRQTNLISKFHYQKEKIHIQSILSTHKHHDHTAGNRALAQSKEFGEGIKSVYGGAVERVPECNCPLKNGDKLALPRDGRNDMKGLIEVEAIATPGHTRGSLSFALRPISNDSSSMSTVLFTGDTMFSGGGGVPFEADSGQNQDGKSSKITGDNYLKASAGVHAVERCFSEILFRCVPFAGMHLVSSDRIVVLPGHEYSYELMNRQLQQSTESCKWKSFSPNVFFETMSHFYVALHQRQLPTSSGNILVAPSTLSRELLINPNLRSLRKRADVVLSAIRLWNRHFATSPVSDDVHGAFGTNGSFDKGPDPPEKSKATKRQWNLDAQDLNASVFTTVYSADFEKVIEDLDTGRIEPHKAAQRLRQLKSMLDVPAVGRRPIPRTLPTDRVVYKGLLGLALLGSSPTAMTLSDSQAMKLPHPVDGSSDLIVVSKKRLIAVLYWLGLLSEEHEGKRTVKMIENLWSAAKGHELQLDTSGDTQSTRNTIQYDSVDLESSATVANDTVDLGSLKWILYGVPSARPSCLPSFCMPCSKPRVPPGQKHPIEDCGMKKENGELVRHDIFSCPICKGAAGCPKLLEQEEVDAGTGNTLYLMGTSEDADEAGDEDDESAYIEVTSDAFGSILREA